MKGEEICLGARIFSVVDAYDAMRSDRPYAKAISREEAIHEVRKNSGTQFDPEIVEIFLDCVSELEMAGGWVEDACSAAPSENAAVSATK